MNCRKLHTASPPLSDRQTEDARICSKMPPDEWLLRRGSECLDGLGTSGFGLLRHRRQTRGISGDGSHLARRPASLAPPPQMTDPCDRVRFGWLLVLVAVDGRSRGHVDYRRGHAVARSHSFIHVTPARDVERATSGTVRSTGPSGEVRSASGAYHKPATQSAAAAANERQGVIRTVPGAGDT